MRTAIKNAADMVFKITFPVTERLLAANYRRKIADTRIHKPIIVIGPDRSGTSLIYALLANHPEVYVLTTAADRFPQHPLSASMARKLLSRKTSEDYRSVPNTIGGIQGGRFTVTEAIHYWARHLGSRKGGWEEAPDDYFTEKDLDDVTRKTLPLDLKKRISIFNKNRLAIKQPGFSLKIRYLNALFPDAIFVHCLRHPLDNFHSLMAQKIKTQNPNWGVRIPGWRQFSHLSTEAQTAHQLADTYKIILQTIHHIGDSTGRYVPVRFESFETSYVTEVQKLFDGCQLEVPPNILNNPEIHVHPGNSRKGQEPPADPMAREILEKLCIRMGYESLSASRS